MEIWYKEINGKIAEVANFKKGPNWKLSATEIVDGGDGAFYFKGQEPLPQPPTLEEARNAKLIEINAGYSTVMGFIQAGYPQEEVLSWERQATQARELAQNPEAEAAFVRSLAATKNLPVEEMCARILANAASWEPVAAMLTGARQVMEGAAHAAETVEELQAIKVAYRA